MKKVLTLLICAAIALGLAGCAKETIGMNVYFKSGAPEGGLTQETRKVDATATSAELAETLINALIEGPQEELNSAVMPKGIRLLGVMAADGGLKVDFSREIESLEGADELLCRFAVVSTLCEIQGVNSVQMTVEGRPLISKSTGKEVGVISKSDVVNGMQDPGASEKTMITLYFPNEDAEALVAENREIELTNTLTRERAVVSELIKGPKVKGLIPALPAETKIISVETTDGVCFVNFSTEFVEKASGGSTETVMAVYSVVNSLTSLDGVNSVQILVDGKNGVEFGNFVLDEPFVRNTEYLAQ